VSRGQEDDNFERVQTAEVIINKLEKEQNSGRDKVKRGQL
jgi:hypothetical protein